MQSDVIMRALLYLWMVVYLGIGLVGLLHTITSFVVWLKARLGHFPPRGSE